MKHNPKEEEDLQNSLRKLAWKGGLSWEITAYFKICRNGNYFCKNLTLFHAAAQTVFTIARNQANNSSVRREVHVRSVEGRTVLHRVGGTLRRRATLRNGRGWVELPWVFRLYGRHLRLQKRLRLRLAGVIETKYLSCENQKQQIPKQKWCDGTAHCHDASDEKYCQWLRTRNATIQVVNWNDP